MKDTDSDLFDVKETATENIPPAVLRKTTAKQFHKLYDTFPHRAEVICLWVEKRKTEDGNGKDEWNTWTAHCVYVNSTQNIIRWVNIDMTDRGDEDRNYEILWAAINRQSYYMVEAYRQGNKDLNRNVLEPYAGFLGEKMRMRREWSTAEKCNVDLNVRWINSIHLLFPITLVIAFNDNGLYAIRSYSSCFDSGHFYRRLDDVLLMEMNE